MRLCWQVIKIWIQLFRKQSGNLSNYTNGANTTNFQFKIKKHNVLFQTKNKPVPRNLEIIETEYITISRVKGIQYLAIVIDRYLYRHAHVDYVYGSLIKYFRVFNHIKLYVSWRIVRQFYFAFINSRIRYEIEVYGHYAKERFGKLQTLQNKLLKLQLKLYWRTSTNQLHTDISLLKVSDIHTVGLLSFVNESTVGRCPELFLNYFKIRKSEYALRNTQRLDVPWARTELGSSRCDIKVAKLWNEYFATVNELLYKKCFRKRLTNH